MKTLILAFALLIPRFGYASDEAQPLDVEIVNLAPDIKSAEAIIYTLKEKIRASKGLRLTTSQQYSHVRLMITASTLNPGEITILGISYVQTIPDADFTVYLGSSIVAISAYNQETALRTILMDSEKTGQKILSKLEKRP